MTWGLVAYGLAVVIVLVAVAMLFKDDTWPKWLIGKEPHVKYDELDMYDARPPLDGHWR